MDVVDPSVTTLEVTNKVKLLQLCKNLFTNSVKVSEIKINKYLKKESFSEMVFMININQVNEEAVVQVVDETPLHNLIRIPLPEDILNSLVIVENDIIKCPETLDTILVTVINSIVAGLERAEVITVPVLYKFSTNKPICNDTQHQLCPKYLICFVNSKKDALFLIKLVDECFSIIWNILSSTLHLDNEVQSRKSSQIILQATRSLMSGSIRNLKKLIQCIVNESKKHLRAERCLLYLLDESKDELVLSAVDDEIFPKIEIRLPKYTGLLGQTVTCGQVLNIYKDPAAYIIHEDFDKYYKLYVEQVLCFPIKNETSITGVVQLCNKMKYNRFDFNDEVLVNGLGYCYGIALEQCKEYCAHYDKYIKRKIVPKFVLNIPKIRDELIADLMLCPAIHDHPNFEQINFNPREIIIKETPCFVLKMLDNLGLPEEFNIRRYALAKFIYYVQHTYKNYNPYHNWLHGFSTAHFSYITVKILKLVQLNYLTKLECLAYFISCLCHDLGHTGSFYNPLYNENEGLTLANLYTSEGSILENSHLHYVYTLLNETDCNFVKNLPEPEYKTFLLLLRDFILGTDLTRHFELRPEQLNVAYSGYKCNDNKHRHLMLNLLMTCADFSDQIKPFPVVRLTAQNVYQEFFYKSRAAKTFAMFPTMDRSKTPCEIPQMQIDFINAVVLPAFVILTTVFPPLKVMVQNIKKNLNCWEKSRSYFESPKNKNCDALTLLASLNLLDEVNLEEKI